MAEADKKEEEEQRKDAKVSTEASKPVAAPIAVKAPAPTPLVDDSLPFDSAALGTYAESIADAAEDNEPANPVLYHNNMDDKIW